MCMKLKEIVFSSLTFSPILKLNWFFLHYASFFTPALSICIRNDKEFSRKWSFRITDDTSFGMNASDAKQLLCANFPFAEVFGDSKVRPSAFQLFSTRRNLFWRDLHYVCKTNFDVKLFMSILICLCTSTSSIWPLLLLSKTAGFVR